MKLGIMQPYFFPYLGYFSLIKYVDHFVFFDTPQYIVRGWVNRNRILKQDGTATYIGVPVRKSARETAIKDICINNDEKWKEKIYGQLAVYKKKAPYYKTVIDLMRDILDKKWESLSELNICGIEAVCGALGINRKFDIFSRMDLRIGTINAADEWALQISKSMGYDVYVNPPGGKSFFDIEKYTAQNIKVEFLQNELVPYVQKKEHFEAGLSIVDVMMFCDVKETNELLDKYIIL